jgi:hypothetical protein
MQDHLIRMFMRRPFEPFTLFTVDGRELDLRHPEQGSLGHRAETVVLFHPDRRIELVHARHIVSVRTIRPGDIAAYAAE